MVCFGEVFHGVVCFGEVFMVSFGEVFHGVPICMHIDAPAWELPYGDETLLLQKKRSTINKRYFTHISLNSGFSPESNRIQNSSVHPCLSQE